MTNGTRQRRFPRDDRRATPDAMAAVLEEYRAANATGRAVIYPRDPECPCPKCTELRLARDAAA